MRRGEDGSALIEFTWLAIILLVPLVWIVISVFQVQQGAFAVTAAARAAGRAYALAPDDATGLRRAQAVVDQVLADQGGGGQRGRVEVSCRTPVPGNCHVGTAIITLEVSSHVTLPLAPEILGDEVATFALDSTHTVPFGQFVQSSPDENDPDDRDSEGARP